MRRADGSGTSFLFTNYLSKVNAEWKGKVGEGTAVNWPIGAGGKGNEGVAAFVQRLPNSIGYVEYAYVKQNKMSAVPLQNSDRHLRHPDDDAFKAAAAGADWTKSFYQVLTNQPGKQSWPITGATFILMHKAQDKPTSASHALKFFDWAYKNGDKTADDLDYVPMPAAVKDLVRKAVGDRSRTPRARRSPTSNTRRAGPRRWHGARATLPLLRSEPRPLHCPLTAYDAGNMHGAIDPAWPPAGAPTRGPVADALFAAGARRRLLTLPLLVGILVSLFVGAAPAIEQVRPRLPGTSEWDPVQEEYGGLVMIYGTLMTSFIALVIAVPVSFGIALFLTELSPAG